MLYPRQKSWKGIQHLKGIQVNYMYRGYKIKEPFFEYGPKCYMYGDTLLEIAKGLDRLSEKYDVDIILDVPDTEIKNIADHTKTSTFTPSTWTAFPWAGGWGEHCLRP